VNHNAQNCTLASQRARSAEEVARDGSRIVHGVVQAMGDIEKSSERIAEIVGVIEGIAFQTNILALNAAVEGRAGRRPGARLRRRRHRGARAGASQRGGREGGARADPAVGRPGEGRQPPGRGRRAGDRRDRHRRRGGNRLVGEIAGASGEQKSGVQEINRAIMQLEQVTQQNAAMVEEAAAKSMAFQHEADRMMATVARFKIDEAPSPRRARSRKVGGWRTTPRALP
jgi:hypothetical protein